MCGIGGKLSFDETPDGQLGKIMTAEMDHRGPDDEGIYANGPALLAHRRLSILDLSTAGRQPMSNEDETIHIVFNGEIYNYRELRNGLSGHTFSSETDTEALLHLYEKEGINCLKRLRGMFAFAIWDENEERMFLARDRLGQKPLYYYYQNQSLTFGSTIKAILGDKSVAAQPDLEAIRQYLLYQYVPHPDTGFQNIHQLNPAEYMIVDEEGIERDYYWSLSFEEQSTAPRPALADRLKGHLREATKLRMQSDVPLGVFLSGGLDSSIVTSLMAESSDDPVNTYSVGFSEDTYDELEFAREVAQEFGTDHHEYSVTPEVADVLPELVRHYEMPFADPSALPTYYISREASQDTTVILSGDAGDETFAGYRRYTYEKVADLLAKIPGPIRQGGIRGVELFEDQFDTSNLLQYVQRGLKVASKDTVDRYAGLCCPITEEETKAIWEGPTSPRKYDWLAEKYAKTDGPTRIDRLMHLDILTYLPADLLVKVDRASMAHSLEVRSPFLDHHYMEFAASVPATHKYHRGKTKILLKNAFRDTLPDKIIERNKQGFAIPVNKWFRTELRQVARQKLHRLGNREPFNQLGLENILHEHSNKTAQNGRKIWELFMLEMWYEEFIDSRGDTAGAIV
jgi:asparagine synthase (glutamine-hydrolysing)